MKSNKRKYKIMVLSDLNKSSGTTLRSAVGLASMINGDIEVFHVKKPMDIVKGENQLSAMRTINSKHTMTDRKMQGFIAPIAKDCEADIDYSFAFGNAKNEIDAYIKERRPDIIVLGKRKSKPFNFIGDGITEFVLNTFDGVLMIPTDKDAIMPNTAMVIGTLNSLGPSFNLEFADDLLKQASKPLKSFKIVKNSVMAKEMSRPSDNTTVEYVFEHSDGAIKNLSKYLAKNKVNLLSIDRAQKDHDNKQNLMMPDIKSVIGKLNVTLLVSGKQKCIKKITNSTTLKNK